MTEKNWLDRPMPDWIGIPILIVFFLFVVAVMILSIIAIFVCPVYPAVCNAINIWTGYYQ